MSKNPRKATTLATVLALLTPMSAFAEAPSVQTKGTVIYLADNLNEEAKLGWCIDTQGRGFSDKLHAHSCKPGGGDTQFSFDKAKGMIQSVEFTGKCMTLSKPDNKEIPFGLHDCVEGDVSQQFTYNPDTQEFQISKDESLCVAVAEPINQAGPFQSRHLIFARCAELEPSFKQWVIRE